MDGGSSQSTSTPSVCGMCAGCGSMPPWAPEALAVASPAFRAALKVRMEEAQRRFKVEHRARRLQMGLIEQSERHAQPPSAKDGSHNSADDTSRDAAQRPDEASRAEDGESTRDREVPTVLIEANQYTVTTTTTTAASTSSTSSVDCDSEAAPVSRPAAKLRNDVTESSDRSSNTATEGTNALESGAVTTTGAPTTPVLVIPPQAPLRAPPDIQVSPTVPKRKPSRRAASSSASLADSDAESFHTAGDDAVDLRSSPLSRRVAPDEASDIDSDLVGLQSRSPVHPSQDLASRDTSLSSAAAVVRELPSAASSSNARDGSAATPWENAPARVSMEDFDTSRDDDVVGPVPRRGSVPLGSDDGDDEGQLQSVSTDNLEDVVMERRTRTTSRYSSRRQWHDVPSPSNARIVDGSPRHATGGDYGASSIAEVSLASDDVVVQRVPRCDDCGTWRRRVQELERKVETLTTKLSSREREIAMLKAKAIEHHEPRSEARLIQECESLRVTTEFLFEKLENYERALTGNQGSIH